MLWKEKYQLGVPEIDKQHEELFRRVDEFLLALRGVVTWEEKVERVNETLAFMQSYVVDHFRDEESYQLRIGYPGYESHRKAHEGMVVYVGQMAENYQKNNCNEQLIQQFAGRLLAWLINHVAADDQHIGAYAAEMGVNEDAN